MNKALAPELNTLLIRMRRLSLEDYRASAAQMAELTRRALEFVPSTNEYLKMREAIEGGIRIFDAVADSPVEEREVWQELFRIMHNAQILILKTRLY